MALKFQDFKPQSTGFFKEESEAEVLVRLNTWLAEREVQAINVETLIEGGGNYSVRPGGFRVWYQANRVR